jgi:RNA polymerase sigma factor (sigma-70 family)
MSRPYGNLEDEKIMCLYREGDAVAFEELYLRHHKKIYSYLSKRVHDRNEVDDLFQKALMKFHKSRHLYDEKYSFLSWLYTITKSEFLDHCKKKKINAVEFEENLHTQQDESTSSEIDIASEKSLTDKEKEALIQRYYKDSDFDEISKLLNTSEANIRKLVSRGIKKLKLKYNKGGA